MTTPQEELNETQSRFDLNLTKFKELEKEIKELQQLLIEDQGAIKALRKCVGTTELEKV